MQFTETTPLACVLCVIILCLSPQRGLIALFSTLPFGSAAAVNLAGLGSIFIAEAAMLSLCISIFLNGARGGDVLSLFGLRGAALPLLCLMGITGIGAVFLPRVNGGMTEVYTLVRQADSATLALGPLGPTGSNIGQYLRMFLSGLAFAVGALTMLRATHAVMVRHAVLAATLMHILLAALDLIGPIGGFSLLEPFRNAYVSILDNQVLLGMRRLIGGFPEPSAFGVFTMGLYGYWLRLWFGAPRALLPFVMVVVTVALLVRSTSSAAYFGLATYTVLFLLWQSRSLVRGGTALVLYAVLAFFVPLLIGLGVLMYQLMPALTEFMNTIVIDKLSSTSGNERMAWNMQALLNFKQTYGMGTGIGSLRASGWPFAVLGSLGVLGAAFYLWFLSVVFSMRLPNNNGDTQDSDTLSALQSACAAVLLLACTILPQPNLGMVFFLLAGTVTGLHGRYWNERGKTRSIWTMAPGPSMGIAQAKQGQSV